MKVMHSDLGGIFLYCVNVDTIASCPPGHSVRLAARFVQHLKVSGSLTSICVREGGHWCSLDSSSNCSMLLSPK